MKVTNRLKKRIFFIHCGKFGKKINVNISKTANYTKITMVAIQNTPAYNNYPHFLKKKIKRKSIIVCVRFCFRIKKTLDHEL